MASGLIAAYLAEGTAAARPVTPDTGSAIALYWATDTDELSGWFENAWVEDLLSGAAGGLLAANNLSDVASATTSRTNLGIGTGDSPQFTALNVGHASDSTITRVSAGLLAIEGSNILTAATGQPLDTDLTSLAGLTLSQGDILYRDGSQLQRLAAGTSGQFLKTNGAGANPAWAAAGDPEGEAALTKPLAASFTLENAGTASMADGTNGLVLTAPSATANARFMRYTAGLPGASWTLTTRGRVIGPHNGAVHVRAIMVRNSTNGRLLTFGDVSNTNTGCQRWSSYTAASTSPFSYGICAADIPWRRLTSDGTTLSFYVSSDGQEWSLVGTEAIVSYLTAAGGGSLDQVGIGLFFGAASTVAQKNIFQSFTLV